MKKNWELYSYDAWELLLNIAINNKTITYQDFGSKLGFFYRSSNIVLETIQQYCINNKLPMINTLVINKDTGKPGSGQIPKINPLKDRQEVYEYVKNNELKNPFFKKVFNTYNQRWILTADGELYNHDLAFKDMGVIDWVQNHYKYEVDDIVYIYSSKEKNNPKQYIKYACIVEKIDIDYEDSIKDDKYWSNPNNIRKDKLFVRLRLLKELSNPITLNDLITFGVKTPLQGARRIKDSILFLIEDRFRNNDFSILEEEIIFQDKVEKEIPNKQFKGNKKPKKSISKSKNTSMQYNRDTKVSSNAKYLAKYLCEYDNNHITFPSKSNGLNYVEAHHLIPTAFEDKFNGNSVDIEENVVALCPMCHAKIHYSNKDNREEIIEKLYTKRINKLKTVGLYITLNDLIKMYE